MTAPADQDPISLSQEPVLPSSESPVPPVVPSPSPPVPPFSPPAPLSAPEPVIQTRFEQPLSPAPKIAKNKKGGGLWRVLIILLVVAAIGIGGWFIYSSRRSGTPLGRKKIVYWGLWENKDIMRPILDEWEKQNPNVTVEYERQSKEQYRERLQSALARGEGPDIFRFHNTWVPVLKGELAVMPAGLMTPSEFEEVFYPVATNDLVWGTEIYGMPLEIDTLALFYNDEIFREAGKLPPTDWNELRDLARELTVRDSSGRIKIAGVAMGSTGNIDHWSDILGLMLIQNGARLPRLTGVLAEDATNFYSYFYRRDQVWDSLFPNSTRAFAGGQLAMYFGFSWDVFEIQRMNENLKFTVIPVPQIPERAPVTWASYWVEGVSAQSGYAQEAWSLLEYLSSPEVARRLYENQVIIGGRSFGEPYARRGMASELAVDPLVSPFIAQAETAVSWYMCSRTFDNAINDSIIVYFENAINAINKGKDVAKELETVSQGLVTKLGQYQVPNDKQLVFPVKSN